MKILRILAATLVVSLIMQAKVPLRLWRLRLTKSCPNCQLAGIDIKNADLKGANLQNADLRWTRFDSVNLSRADLAGADLRHARMNNVTIQDTEFCDARMMNGVKGYCRHPDAP